MDRTAMAIECLNCGETRNELRDTVHRVVHTDCCPRCGYVGWARSDDLSETTRRQLRDRPVTRRRLLSVV
jgi:hypothetical protein